jgi:hypothetical protein
MTGRANEANAEVIRLAEEARDALLEALGLDPATKASEKYVEETVAELDALTSSRRGSASTRRTWTAPRC